MCHKAVSLPSDESIRWIMISELVHGETLSDADLELMKEIEVETCGESHGIHHTKVCNG